MSKINFEFNIQNKCNKVINKIFDYVDCSAKKYRFDIIQEVKTNSLHILKYLVFANNTDITKYPRYETQQKAINSCIYVENLLLICYNRKVISSKQFKDLINELTSLHESLINWQSADQKRFEQKSN